MLNSATPSAPQSALSGWINGFLGVVIFSGSLPATRIAVMDIDPFFLTFIRASIAGTLALILLAVMKIRRPEASQILSLVIVSLGVVVGFPLLTAMALRLITSAHSLVFTGLLPLSTAVFGVIRGGEKPQKPFWIFSVAGSLLVAGFALTGEVSLSASGDLLMLAAIVTCGLGYAEGAKLSRVLGGWQVISWALVISLPFMLIAAYYNLPAHSSHIRTPAWIALGYVSLFSMFLGFIFWYKGLAIGGIAAVGQLQLLQPFIGLCFAVAILHENVTPLMGLVTLGVILCVVGSRKYAHNRTAG
ncbi:DMT family transporter [Rahnella sp. C60]|uniref:DMT family transporter n=1 Tax=Rahnella perminowiae TaxID=2816244 RepID=UPI001C26AF98|nr:DMT family transporter [Rahnella perminowiae]MBU9817973.1 DMT family transporter [Rahnella perminowiae]